MNDTQMKENLLEYIRKNKCVSYAEIERVFEANGYEYKGNIETVSNHNENVVFWCGWSKQAFELLNELIRANLIERVPCEPLVYLIDGKSLTYPPLTGRTKNLKKIHWLPCIFNPV